MGSGRPVRAAPAETPDDPTPPHPPRLLPPRRSSPRPTVWSARPLAARRTRCCTAAARCWRRSCSATTSGRLSRTRPPGEECEPQREEKEKKKKEGLFQRATRFRRSTSPPSGRVRKDEVPPNHTCTPPVNLISMSAIMECNSTKCLLQSEVDVPQPSPGKVELVTVNNHTEPLATSPAATDGPTDRTPAKTQTPVKTQSPPPDPNNHNTGTRLRRKKYNNHNSE